MKDKAVERLNSVSSGHRRQLLPRMAYAQDSPERDYMKSAGGSAQVKSMPSERKINNKLPTLDDAPHLKIEND